MDSKIPLYLSAVALFIAVVASLFFFNLTQKMNKSISSYKTDKNTVVNMGGKIDVLYSDLSSLSVEVSKIKKSLIQKPSVKPETLVVDDSVEADGSVEVDDDSDSDVESIGN